jgi:hypothetical protein
VQVAFIASQQLKGGAGILEMESLSGDGHVLFPREYRLLGKFGHGKGNRSPP